ncbi:MAG: hypothetical protein ACREBF_02395 [Candidatus Micrarchaeales archaeon]
MNKKIIIIGVIVVLAAFIIGSIAIPNALLGVANFANQNIVVLSHQSAFKSLYLNQTGFMVVGFQSLSAVNFYFANSSAFKTLDSYANSSLLLSQWATRLFGNGVYEILPNSTVGIFPYSQLTNSTPSGAYITKNVTLLPAGTYYALFYNPRNISATVNVTSDISTNISSQGAYILGIGLTVFILFIAGIILIIYGIIKKPKSPQVAPAQDKKKLDQLYKGVGKKGSTKGRK